MAAIPESVLYNTPAMKPPPGFTTDFANPAKDGSNATQTIVVLSVLLALTIIMVLLRLYVRFVVVRAPGWDDYCAIAATIGIIGYTADAIYVFAHGFGVHQWNVRVTTLLSLLNYLNALQYLGWPVNLLVKVSLSLLLLRIFGAKRNLRWALYFAIGLNVLTKVIGFFLSIFLCLPGSLSFYSCSWKVTEVVIIIQGFNIFTDFWLLLIPLVGVMQLQMSPRRKFVVSLVFLVGLLACLSSVLGLYYRIRQDRSPDVSWNFSPEIILVIFEFEATTMVGCFILMPSLFRSEHRYSLKSIWSVRSQLIKDYLQSRLSLRSRSGTASDGMNGSKDDFHDDAVELSARENSV